MDSEEEPSKKMSDEEEEDGAELYDAPNYLATPDVAWAASVLNSMRASQPSPYTGMFDGPSPSASSNNNNGASQSGAPPQRLFLGEADLSFADAYTAKHPSQASGVHASTYEGEQALQSLYPSSYSTHRKATEARGATVMNNVDATALGSNPNLAPRYPHIHFNFPHTNSRNASKTPLTNQVVKGFFKSARSKQQPGDQVHMALVRGGKRKQSGHYKGQYQSAQASKEGGYKLIAKKPFDEERYPGYSHKQTKKDTKSKSAHKAREYTFEMLADGAEEPVYDSEAIETDEGSEAEVAADEEHEDFHEPAYRRDDEEDDDGNGGGGNMDLAQPVNEIVV